SLAIAVDLGISFVGLTVSVILYYSIKLANRPADLFHNYGYGKVEHVCEALEGVVLIGIALAIASQAVSHILDPDHINHPWVGFVCSMMSVLLNFGGAYFILLMAKKSKSPAIHAEGVHYQMEGFISGMIGVSFILSMTLNARGFKNIAPFVDPATALLVSAVIVVPSFKLAKGSFFKLLDASAGETSQMEILKQLGKHINKYCEFKDIRTRTSGRKKFIGLKLVVPSTLSVRKGHEVISHIEKDILESIPDCEVLIKMEPCNRDCEHAKRQMACPYAEKG
ncbi:MAG: cation diffusion facilitator family transporter, partial [Candidatus Omnitrophica bacterium]|nr:cation diffusion facilitator family transporter [Candidatus Omnitrophota bacterium]